MEDQQRVEEAFLWFEAQYGKDYLKNIPIIEPTKSFFDHDFKGVEEDAEFALDKICQYMDIKGVAIELYYFVEAPMEFSDEGIIATQNKEGLKAESNYALGKYSEDGSNKFRIGLEKSKLQDTQGMIATLAHELSHLILLGEGRLDENDEPLTDLNCIALGFGIFLSNSIFRFQQWSGVAFGGWQSNRSGYIPEQVAAYAMALFQNYQQNESKWHEHLEKSVKKMYQKNLKYLETTNKEIRFK